MYPPSFGRTSVVLEPHVGERAADQDLVMAPARPVRVELRRGNAVRAQIHPAGEVFGDLTGRRDVVGGDAIPDDDEGTRPAHQHPVVRKPGGGEVQVRCLREVAGLGRPGVVRSVRRVQGLPVDVPDLDRAVLLVEHPGFDAVPHHAAGPPREWARGRGGRPASRSKPGRAVRVVRLRSIRPAKAYATTSIGEAR